MGVARVGFCLFLFRICLFLVAYVGREFALSRVGKYLAKARLFLLKWSWEFQFLSMYICPIDMVWQLHTKIADENAGMRHDMNS
jgi:hypothetical protein